MASKNFTPEHYLKFILKVKELTQKLNRIEVTKLSKQYTVQVKSIAILTKLLVLNKQDNEYQWNYESSFGKEDALPKLSIRVIDVLREEQRERDRNRDDKKSKKSKTYVHPNYGLGSRKLIPLGSRVVNEPEVENILANISGYGNARTVTHPDDIAKIQPVPISIIGKRGVEATFAKNNCGDHESGFTIKQLKIVNKFDVKNNEIVLMSGFEFVGLNSIEFNPSSNQQHLMIQFNFDDEKTICYRHQISIDKQLFFIERANNQFSIRLNN